MAKIEIQPIQTESGLYDLTIGLVEKGSESILLNALQAMPEKEVLGRELGVDDLKSLLNEKSPESSGRKLIPMQS